MNLVCFIGGLKDGLAKAALDQAIGEPLDDSIMGKAPTPKVPGKNKAASTPAQAQVLVPTGG